MEKSKLNTVPYYQYWGKADKNSNQQLKYHLLVYHCLDVAKVAEVWLEQSPVILKKLALNKEQMNELKAWLLFFIALHDLGKFDVRFQMKIPSNFVLKLQPNYKGFDTGLCYKYYHGEYAYNWFFDDFKKPFNWEKKGFNAAPLGEEHWQAFKPWLQAVAGHHGVEPQEFNSDNSDAYFRKDEALKIIREQDQQSRIDFVKAMECLFLEPEGLSIADKPPQINLLLLAGFCSVCDWLGSSFDLEYFKTKPMDLKQYFNSRKEIAQKTVEESGMLSKITGLKGMEVLYPKFKPHQVQTLVDQIPQQAGLTLIEAPTGSGKTEAALAYASYLLDSGTAESIIFALPTQATSNAMFDRLVAIAPHLFKGAETVLAHGKSCFNPHFKKLKFNSYQDKKNELDANVQCSQWLSQSRKRIFLGQIGVCTIDQVLISVLPVKHRFVRTFGLAKSVLIIDEVHAYSAYMYGLLETVLQQQQKNNGSAILLSATLPQYQRQNLLKAWGCSSEVLNEKDPYPLITHTQQNELLCLSLDKTEQAKLMAQKRHVHLNCQEIAEALPDDLLLDKVIQAANNGANVVIICNLVADAQKIAAQLQQQTDHVSLFHSRYRFKDRQKKEMAVLANFGKEKTRRKGQILVATQVVEQSLDIDFDWMISQLCPLDLLFQRLGRLHRHHNIRPKGFEQAQCTVLCPQDQDYQLHALIYGNAQILWRTEMLLKDHPILEFPQAYRPMIEKVYQEKVWGNEPENVLQQYDEYQVLENTKKSFAKKLAKDAGKTAYEDSDQNISALTRDGEMSLSIVLIIKKQGLDYFIDNSQAIKSIDETDIIEELMLNTIPTPKSWQSDIEKIAKLNADNGIYYLEMKVDKADSFLAKGFKYSIKNGLEKIAF